MSRLPANYLKCVIALGVKDPSEGDVKWTATGLLYGYVPPEREDLCYIYLVTNRHCVEEIKELYLRFNPAVERSRARHYQCPLVDRSGRKLWCGHPDPDVDVAVLPFDFAALRVKEKLSELIFHGQVSAYRTPEMKVLVREGDDVFLLGFPMGVVGSFRNAVVVRRGCIAQIQDLYSGHSDCYLVDGNAFPGNSGGPVILAPESFTPSDHPPLRPALIGVVYSYLPYQDVATSSQTGHARVLFEENSALTLVYPVDRIEETIRAHLASSSRRGRGTRRQTTKARSKVGKSGSRSAPAKAPRAVPKKPARKAPKKPAG